ncbi:MAG: hydrolase, partial [Enterococcus cecorum]|nr:hydrolase [Enterococcus cecorum]
MLTNREDKQAKQMPELFSELRQSVVHLPKV